MPLHDQYSELTQPARTDVIYVEDDPAGTPANKHMELGALITQYNVTHYGADPTGVADSTTAIQAAIDAASTAAHPGSVLLPDGDYLISDTLNIYCGISFGGWPSAGGRWNRAGDEHKGVRIIVEGTNPAILIAGTAASPALVWQMEGAYLHDLLILPDDVADAVGGAVGTTTGGTYGIVLNGSQAGTDPSASREACFDIRFDRVVVRNFATNNWRLEGNVFDIRFNDCTSMAAGDDGLETVTVTSSGLNHPGQLHFRGCYFSSNVEDKWAIDLGAATGCSFYTGGIAGTGDGLTMGSFCVVSGATNFEGTAGATTKIGCRIMGQGCVILASIKGWITALQIGNSSTENCSGWQYLGGYIDATTNGLLVTAGGARNGVFHEPAWGTPTNKITNTRWTTDGTQDVSFPGSGGVTVFTSDATPDVFHKHVIRLAGTMTITDFDNGYEGQIITCILAAATVDFQHAGGGALYLADAVTWTAGEIGDVIVFVKRSTTWREVCRSKALLGNVSGTLVLDDGSTEKITLTFTNGRLTARLVEATTSSVTANWTD